jgi:hypothetical protein
MDVKYDPTKVKEICLAGKNGQVGETNMKIKSKHFRRPENGGFIAESLPGSYMGDKGADPFTSPQSVVQELCRRPHTVFLLNYPF